MKFIGQFIQNFIARFRNDVYLESTETGTIASGGNLGLDSNNKIVKNTISSTTDLTSDVTGVLPVSNGGTGNSTLTSNSILTGNGTSAVVAESLLTFTNQTLSMLNSNDDKFEIVVGSVGDTTISTVDDGGSGDGTSADLLVDIDGDITLDSHTGAHYIKNNGTTFATFQSDIFKLDSSASSTPEIQLINSNTDANAPGLSFVKSATGADDDALGRIQFIGDNESDAQHLYALIEGSIKDATADQESGLLELKVADHDNTMTTGLKLDGDHSDGEVDVTIANGVGSTTTVSGSLFLGGSDGTPHTIGLNAHDDGSGGALTIRAGSAGSGVSNADGGNLNFNAGLSTGGQFGGDFIFNTSYRGSAGSSLNSNFDILKISPDLSGTGQVGLQAFPANVTDDFFFITVGNNASSSIGTFDADASLADLAINVDGDLTETCVDYGLDASGSITLDSGGGVSFFENGVSRYRFLVDSTPEVDITGDFTIDCTGNVEINADGGSIDFKDGTAQLAKIDTNGLSFVDNTAAAIIFEGDTDNDHQTTFKPSDPTADRTIILPDATGTLLLKDNVNPGKQFQVFQCNFIDDLNTSEVFIPIHGTTFEGAQVYQDDVAILAPCDGRIVSLDFKCISLTNDGDLTVKIYTLPPNTVGTSGGGTATTNWTEEESETISVTSTDDNHVFHFAFDNAKHFESTEMFALSIQASADVTGNTFMYATVVVEFDYSTLLGSTSAEFETTP